MNTVVSTGASGPTSGLDRTGTPRRLWCQSDSRCEGRFAVKALFIRTVMTITIPGLLAGCAMVAAEPVIPAVSVEPLEYYSGEVKGYQKSLPEDRVLVLLPVDSRHPPVLKDAGDLGPAVPGGSVEVGVISDQNGGILQQIYSPAIEPIVQSALAKSAKEAGLAPAVSDDALERALHRTDEDYVLASEITGCSVTRRRLSDPLWGATWVTEAEFALEVEIYKPPFHVAFWQGSKAIDYYDPPLIYGGLEPGDSVSLYDRPGQVLSVALTRAVAGIFAEHDLQELVVEDSSSKQRGLGRQRKSQNERGQL